MKIEHNLDYLPSNDILVEAALANDVIGKICLEGNFKHREQIIQIADYLENNFRMYQYKKDNGVKYKTEDLFFWTNCQREEMTYFDVTVNSETLEGHNEIVNTVVKYLEENYSDTEIYVSLQYTRRFDWNKINQFLKQDFDLNNLPVSVLQILHSESKYCGRKFTEQDIEKLNKLSTLYLDQFVGKKVIWNGQIKGTIRKLSDGFGLFKPRAKKSYYPLELGNIKSLSLI